MLVLPSARSRRRYRNRCVCNRRVDSSGINPNIYRTSLRLKHRASPSKKQRKQVPQADFVHLTPPKVGSILGASTYGQYPVYLSYRPAGPRGWVVRSPALLLIRAHLRQRRANHVASDLLLLQHNGYGGWYGWGILFRSIAGRGWERGCSYRACPPLQIRTRGSCVYSGALPQL